MRKYVFLFGLHFILMIANAQSPMHIGISGASVEVGTPSIVDSVYNELPFKHLVDIKKINEQLFHVHINILPEKNCKPGSIDIPINIVLSNSDQVQESENSFHWLPNIKSSPDQVIAQHVFRSPCIILTIKKNTLAFIPDIHAIKNNAVAPYYMDLKYEQKKIVIHYGLSNYTIVSHQYYKKNDKTFPLTKKLELAFYLLVNKNADPLAALKMTNHFLWENFAKNYTHSYSPQVVPFSKYAFTGYEMALTHYWVDAGKDKGGITLSTFYDTLTKTFRGRDSKDDLWYQSWFNNIRTAYGLFAWGKRLDQEDWKQKAIASINLLLDAPRDKGWFPTIYNSGDKQWITSGQGGGPDVYHLPDNIWTAYWLMRFNDELQTVKGIDELTTDLANAILNVQNDDGSFPTRLIARTHQADTVLNSTASSGIATWYLEELLLRNKIADSRKEIFQKAILRSLNFLETHVLPKQRFEDFESYFSCSPKPMHYFDTSTHMYAQNTLSIQWCSEAFLKAYQFFHDNKYLNQGEYCLNILSLYQQIWNPPYIHFYAFGGFGAQNTDAEWSDARQAQFAETYLDYYFITKKKEYLERAVYACRASFALMVLPENKNISPDNYEGTSFNGESYPGNMAENYGHSGYDVRSNQSGFHWGTGSALTTAAIFKNKLGDIYVTKNWALGVDGIVVKNLHYANGGINIITERINNTQITAVTDGNVKSPVVVDDKKIKRLIK